MVLEDLKDFSARVGKQRRFLGIDLGTKTLGLALSDYSGMVASPLKTLPKGKFSKDVLALRNLIGEHEVKAIVLGLPREMDGSDGKRVQSTRAFASNLSREIDLEILLWDERLSTVAVERVLIKEADLTRKRRADVVDRAAAAFILQGVLDALQHLKED